MTDVKKLITEHLDIWLTAKTEKKSGRGRSSGSSDSIYGIQKLRELIYSLAFEGKLVEHSNYTAQDFIEGIIIERDKLVKEMKIKRNKVLPINEKDKIPYELPKSWKWEKLGNLGLITSSSRVHQKDWSEEGVPFLRAREIIKLAQYGFVENDLFISEGLYFELTKQGIVPENKDIMLTGVGTIGVPYVVNEKDKFYFKDASVLIFKNFSKFEPYYLEKFFKSPLWIKQIHEESMGTTVHTLTINRANEILIPIPPLDEQQCIVTKVDELMQLCDQLEQQQNLSSEAHDQLVDTLLNVLTNSSNADEFQQNWQCISENFDLLFITEYSIDQLKQTILQLAVMGKLVKPEAMDETTKLEIHQHKINFSKKNSEANFVNFHGLNELKNSFSKNMEIFRLGDIADIVRGGSPRPAGDLRFYEGNIPFLKVADITRSKGKFVEGHTSTIKEAGLHKTRFIDSRTVLLTNSGATLGVPAICDFPTTFNDGVAAFINLSNHVFDEYLYLYLSTLTKWFLNVAAQGQGQPNLNTDIVKSTWIALPTRKVQKDIVDMVDNLFSIIDRLQTLQSKMRKTQHHLADSFVANALLDSTDRHEAETEDNIIQFEKPIETIKHSKQKSTDQIDLFTYENVDDDLKLLSLAAEITFQLHTEPTFGHLKLQKLVYLCQQLKHMDLAADFKQHAAGPYDPVMARYLDKEFKNREWFSYDPKRDLKYKPLSRCNDHRSAFNRYFAEDVSEIYDLIGLFRTSKSDHIEIVATLFACWLRLLEKKLSVTEEQLLKDFYAWSEEKKRFSKAEVLTGYKWMHQYSVIPQLLSKT